MKNIFVKKYPAFLFLALLCALQTIHGQSFSGGALDAMDKAFAETDTEFTAQDEYYLGRAVAATILSRYRLYTGNRRLTNYLNRICSTLAINSGKAEPFKGYSVVILDSPQFNAFATPGGHILITKALIDAASSEDALAGIIAHEMAHIQLKHGIAVVNNQKTNENMAAIAERAQVFNTKTKNSGSAQKVMDLRNSVTPLIDAMLQNGYSQAQEFEADKEAVAILAASGYDPAALVEMLTALQKVQSTQQGGFNSTHPAPAQRISSVQGTVTRYQVNNTRLFRTPRYEITVKQ